MDDASRAFGDGLNYVSALLAIQMRNMEAMRLAQQMMLEDLGDLAKHVRDAGGVAPSLLRCSAVQGARYLGFRSRFYRLRSDPATRFELPEDTYPRQIGRLARRRF